jgi:hypothetical protein
VICPATDASVRGPHKCSRKQVDDKHCWPCAHKIVATSSYLSIYLFQHTCMEDGSVAPERVLQICQLVQSEMVRSHCIHVKPTENLPKQTLLSFQYLGLTPSSIIRKRTSKAVVDLNQIHVLKLSKVTNRMLWGKFGYFLNFPEQLTDDKVYYPLQKFTNNVFVDTMFQEREICQNIAPQESGFYFHTQK